GQVERAEKLAAVRVRVGAHAPVALRGELGEVVDEATIRIEESIGLVAAHPLLELFEMVGSARDLGERQLVRTEGAFDRQAVDALRTGPALRRAEHDGRPAGPRQSALLAGGPLDLTDARVALVERGRQCLVYPGGLVALDEQRVVVVREEQLGDLLV